MTQKRLLSSMSLAAILALLLLVVGFAPAVSGHAAAPPPDYRTRLLHDCEDDYHGGHGNIGGRVGHDLHALDVQEKWTSALGHHLVFRLILNGDDDETITVAMKAAGASKSYDFVRSGGSWGGTFDKVTHIADIGDGERFALEGIVKRSTLGVTVGDKLDDYTVTGKSGGEQNDRIPGNDRTLGGCRQGDAPDISFERRDYTIEGPAQYVEMCFPENPEAPSDEQCPDPFAIQSVAGKERFVTLTIKSVTRDAAQTATVTLDGQGAQVRLHEPSSGEYVPEASFDISKRGTQGGDTASIHVAIQGDSPGSGSATVTVTTSLGGRITDTLDFEITPAGAGTTGTTTDSVTTTTMEGEESPGFASATALLMLAALALAARRR